MRIVYQYALSGIPDRKHTFSTTPTTLDSIAEKAAKHYAENYGYYSWPMKFKLWCGEEYLGEFEVSREVETNFYAKKIEGKSDD